MTTIAYRDGALAADRLITSSGVRDSKTTKLFQRGDGALIACAGNAFLSAAYCRWFLDGENGERPSLGVDANDNAGGIIVRPDGVVETFDRHGWITVDCEFLAMGSGRESALGAMVMGADARRAVEVAAEIDIYTGTEIDVLRLPNSGADRIIEIDPKDWEKATRQAIYWASGKQISK
jgi:20S proteasome alpha/beta subunit